MNFALSILSAIFLIVLFPNFNWTWLAPVALTPVILACAREASWKRRFLNGWAAGFVFWFGICTWIQFVLEVHGGLGRWGGWATFVLFAALKGLHLAIFAALAGFLMPKPYAIVAVAALWAGLERTNGPLGFAWLDLGNAGIDMPVAMRVAPYTGVYGVSFVFALLAGAVALVILRRPRKELLPLLVLPFLLLLPAAPPPQTATERVRVVQPNIDSEAQWTDVSLNSTIRQLDLLSIGPGVKLIVWPEVPAPFYYPGDPQFVEELSAVARLSHTPLLAGVVSENAKREPLNAAVMLDDTGTMIDRYAKIKLVPFGEFVPKMFFWVNKITKETGDFAPGDRVVTFPLGSNRIGVFICYESAFPDLVREFAKSGAEALFNLSNDGYFGHSAAREQHLMLVRMRAAENRRWILRSTNDGITATIDPAGRITERLPLYQQIAATMRINFVHETTPYTRYGDWFAWIALLAAIGMAMSAGLQARRRP